MSQEALNPGTVRPALSPEEIGQHDEHNPNPDKRNHTGNEIRIDHEAQPAEQRNNRFLLFSVDKEAQPD